SRAAWLLLPTVAVRARRIASPSAWATAPSTISRSEQVPTLDRASIARGVGRSAARPASAPVDDTRESGPRSRLEIQGKTASIVLISWSPPGLTDAPALLLQGKGSATWRETR